MADPGTFCDRTLSALIAFQSDYGIRVDGRCDEQTWGALEEASWTLGDRLLYPRTPMLRGEDVADLQARLSRLGFNCGRADGIFGPRTARAVSDFQQNCGLDITGVCGPDDVLTLARVGGHSGTGPGIAMVREAIALGDGAPHERRVAVGQFGSLSPVAHAITRRLRENHPLTIGVDGDASRQAEAANRYDADAYVGLEPSESGRCVVSFFSVPTFESVGGRSLAERVCAALNRRLPEFGTTIEGARLPVLRETRMPAVLVSLGPPETVSVCIPPIVATVSDAVEQWIVEPLA